MKKRCVLLTFALIFLIIGCSAQNDLSPDYSYSTHAYEDESKYDTTLVDADKLKDGQPVWALREQASNFKNEFKGLVKLPIWGYDLRFCDASTADLTTITDFSDISFDTSTVWPKQLPQGFSPNEILEFNKDPGLRIRKLHEQGIVGSGVGIAIIDQALLAEHEQYKDNLMLYERIHCRDEQAQMHGSAVASIAVGKDVGVAPGAKLYYIASTFGHYSGGEYVFDASIIADCISRIVELNQRLPKNEKIRVISISRGYGKESPGYEQITKAIEQADKAGILVLTTSTDEYYDFQLLGLGRSYPDDPNNTHSYIPESWTIYLYSQTGFASNCYFVPTGSRTYASFTGNTSYEIGREGGMSWGIPWFAGLYALCCQVNPDLTPKEFIAAVKTTAITTDIEHNGTTYQQVNIVDPAATIELIKKKNKSLFK